MNQFSYALFLFPTRFAKITIMIVVVSIITDNAFIFGVMPVFNCVYILIGKVFVSAPVTKILITTSSNDMAKDKSIPDIIAGDIRGNVISQNALAPEAPRSLAASTKD
jgi:hypothetical protein